VPKKRGFTVNRRVVPADNQPGSQRAESSFRIIC